MQSKLLILVNNFEQMSVYCTIYFKGESVLHSYSSLFKGDVKLLLSTDQKRRCVFECRLLRLHNYVKLYRGLSLVNKDCVGGDYTELWSLSSA